MKKTILLTLVLLSFLQIAFVSKKIHTDVYRVDIKLSSLEWYAEKFGGKHNGTIQFSSGEIKNNHGNLTGTFEIDMKTIANTDLDAGEWRTKLEGHLKSADFFDVEKFPTSKFIITTATPVKDMKAGSATHRVTGMLTIKDKTNEISFDAVIVMQENKISCTGSALIDRSKFDVKYASQTFFPNIGDKKVMDEFTLKFNMVAAK